ncbi:Uncharacterised protein [Chlamydia trachomatis]|nr:Uncharacterised protein [Chlamydia trachomatis]
MRILSFRIDKMLTFGNLSHLVFLVMTNWEYRFLELPIIDLRQKVGLVFHRVRACAKPFLTLYPFCLRIMPRRNKVVILSTLLMESTKLNHSVAHHVRIWSKTSPHLVHSVLCYLTPILLMTINDFQRATETACNCCRHLNIFFRITIPFFLFFRANTDIKAIGRKSEPCKFVDYNRTIDTAREQHCNTFIFDFIIIHTAKLLIFINF